MSAFLVSPYHINAMVSWAHAHQVTGQYNGEPFDFESPVSCEVIGEILYEANVAAIAERYGADAAEEDSAECPYEFELLTELPSPGTVFNGCTCYAYQASEARTWSRSMAYAMVTAIEQAASKFPTSPNDGAWEIEPEHVKP